MQVGGADIQAKRILVFIPNWVGDVVMCTAALRAVRRRFAGAHIAYLLRPYVAEVLAETRFFDEIIHWSGGWFGLASRLRRAGFDLAILFTNSFRSALLARLAGTRRRVGYARESRGWLLTDKLEPARSARSFVPTPALDYYSAIARYLGCRDVSDRLELATSAQDESAIDRRLGERDPTRPLVVFNPGANFGSAKCWPAEKYAALSDALIEQFGARVVASLGPKERAIADEIAAAARKPIDIFVDPPLGLGPLKALVRRSDLLVTNDTGPRHFAAAFDVPVVTIFGSSDPAWTETRFPRERIVKLDLDCQPCMERVCPLKHHNCMRELEPSLVLEKIAELLPRDKYMGESRPTVGFAWRSLA